MAGETLQNPRIAPLEEKQNLRRGQQNGLRNAASFLIRATGTLVFDRGDRFATDYSELGDEFAKAGQQFDVEIGGSFLADSQPDKYTYTAVGGETAEAVRDAFS